MSGTVGGGALPPARRSAPPPGYLEPKTGAARLPTLRSDAEPRRRLAAALLAALVLHNLEEGLAYPRHAPAAEALLAAWWGTPVALPSVAAFEVALVAVTLLGGALLLWAATGPATPGRRGALRLVALVLLLNVALPHVPAALLLGGYAPGLVTALLVNLPLGLWVLRAVPARAAPTPGPGLAR